jgi:hypothetical protein
MYALLWRKLPGGLAGKLASCALLAVAAIALLVFVLFPWIEPRLPWNDVTVNSPSIVQTPDQSPIPSGPVEEEPSDLPIS